MAKIESESESESEMETHPIEARSGESVQVKSAAKGLLLQQAEAFLLRRIVKARDAYEIHVLLQKGAVLSLPAALLANYQMPSQFTYGVDSAGECYL